MEPEIQKKGEVILYHPSETTKLEVRLENETVWLTQQQIADLSCVDRTSILKHIRNIYQSDELEESSTCAKNAQVRFEGGRKVVRDIPFYNLDMILSIGYRVNSKKAILFRRWASSVLKEYLIKGYVVNNNVLATMQKQIDDRFISLQEHTDNRLYDIEKHLEQHDEQIAFFIRTNQPPIEGIFYEGQVLDARDFAETLIKSAQKEVLLSTITSTLGHLRYLKCEAIVYRQLYMWNVWAVDLEPYSRYRRSRLADRLTCARQRSAYTTASLSSMM